MRLVKFPHLTTKRHSAYKHTPSIRLAATCKNFPQPCKRSMQKHNRSGRPLCVKVNTAMRCSLRALPVGVAKGWRRRRLGDCKISIIANYIRTIPPSFATQTPPPFTQGRLSLRLYISPINYNLMV